MGDFSFYFSMMWMLCFKWENELKTRDVCKATAINEEKMMTCSCSLRASIAEIKHHACEGGQKQVIAGGWLELVLITLTGTSQTRRTDGACFLLCRMQSKVLKRYERAREMVSEEEGTSGKGSEDGAVTISRIPVCMNKSVLRD